MKKLFLLLAVSAIALTSCSKDDDSSSSNGGKLIMTIDNVTKTFNNIVVVEEEIEGVTSIYVTATVGNSTSDIVYLELEKNVIGEDAISNFEYKKNNVTYSYDSMINNVTVASGNKLKGSFSGQIVDEDYTDYLTISSGSFDISY
ncbi:hypothetical protein [Flavobacterium sp.]|uniref:hypothetical protein n=1 Tax=Flavobacterium sp. TaxID=239 RepID=UPI00261947EB|nr:hypothetical protein [Flavobacterium sp.]